MTTQHQSLMSEAANGTLSQIEHSLSSSLDVSKIIEDKLVNAEIGFPKKRPAADVIGFRSNANNRHRFSGDTDINRVALIANLSSMR